MHLDRIVLSGGKELQIFAQINQSDLICEKERNRCDTFQKCSMSALHRQAIDNSLSCVNIVNDILCVHFRPEMAMGPNFLIQPNPTHPPLLVRTILL